MAFGFSRKDCGRIQKAVKQTEANPITGVGGTQPRGSLTFPCLVRATLGADLDAGDSATATTAGGATIVVWDDLMGSGTIASGTKIYALQDLSDGKMYCIAAPCEA